MNTAADRIGVWLSEVARHWKPQRNGHEIYLPFPTKRVKPPHKQAFCRAYSCHMFTASAAVDAFSAVVKVFVYLFVLCFQTRPPFEKSPSACLRQFYGQRRLVPVLCLSPCLKTGRAGLKYGEPPLDIDPSPNE